MRFWDSSALVPLIVEEERSSRCRVLRRADRTMVVWALSRTELVSVTGVTPKKSVCGAERGFRRG